MPSLAEQASEAIHRAGGRMTTQRQIIIDLLENVDGQLDAEALYALARQRDPSISIATVYRTMHVLEAAGIVQPRYLSPDHERRYYEPADTAEQYHFTCRVCRRVISFKSELIRKLKQELAEELSLDVLNACVCVDGVCPACRAKEIEAAQATGASNATQG